MQQSCTYRILFLWPLFAALSLDAQVINADTTPHDSICTLPPVAVEAVQNIARPGQTIHQLSIREAAAAKGHSLAEAVATVPGVSLVRTGNNIALPMIRGMYGNRIVVVADGVRHESQQWSSDHAPALDLFGADHITVIKGAEAVRYGSEALGGVIVTEPEAVPAGRKLAGDAWLGGFSNGQKGAASLRLHGSTALKNSSLQWRTQATAMRGGDISTPDYRLLNTGSSERAATSSLRWTHARAGSLLVYGSWYQSVLGIFRGSHLGNLTDLQQTINREQPLPQYTPDTFSYAIGRPRQQVQHTLLKARWTSPFLPKIGTLSLQWAGQSNHRAEYDANRPRGVSDPETADLTFQLKTQTADLAWKHLPARVWTGESGASAMWQEHVQGGRQRLLPSFVQQQAGLYSRWQYHSSHHLLLEAGIRGEMRHLRAWLHETSGTRIFDQTYGSFAGVLGLHGELTERTHANLSLATGWRAPNVSELFSRGVHHGQSRYELGDSTLRSERALNLSATITHLYKSLKFSAEPYVSFTSDYIYAEPMGAPVLTIRGAFPAFAFAQADALFAGLDGLISFREQAQAGLQGSATMSLLRATNLQARTPLPYMPASRVSLSGNWLQTVSPLSWLEAWAIGAKVTGADRQRRIPAQSQEHPADFAPPPAGYVVATLWAEATCISRQGRHGQTLKIRLSADNLFNARYRDYLNAFRYFTDEPGRSINLQLHLSF